MIRRLIVRLLLLIGFGGTLACGSPSDPTPLCQTNNTATITFSNISRTFTYDVIWDGVRIVTGLAPGITSPPTTAAANVAHSAIFRRGTSTIGCSGNPILVRCDATTLTCGT